jgi:hypothetical protein
LFCKRLKTPQRRQIDDFKGRENHIDRGQWVQSVAILITINHIKAQTAKHPQNIRPPASHSNNRIKDPPAKPPYQPNAKYSFVTPYVNMLSTPGLFDNNTPSNACRLSS